jgi:hypothetical protein
MRLAGLAGLRGRLAREPGDPPVLRQVSADAAAIKDAAEDAVEAIEAARAYVK